MDNKKVFKLMRVVSICLILALLVYARIVKAEVITPEENLALYNSRIQKRLELINQEINRRHSIELEAKKLEVIARLELLSADSVSISNNVRASSNSSVKNKNLNRVKVESENSNVND